MALLDFIGGNPDRHGGNFILERDNSGNRTGRILAIDNSDFAKIAETDDDEAFFFNGMVGGSDNVRLDDPGTLFSHRVDEKAPRNEQIQQRAEGMADVVNIQRRQRYQDDAGSQINVTDTGINRELDAVFDEFFDEGKLAEIQQSFGMKNRLEGHSREEIKREFVNLASNMWNDSQMGLD
jgi:hypothetical protein